MAKLRRENIAIHLLSSNNDNDIELQALDAILKKN